MYVLPSGCVLVYAINTDLGGKMLHWIQRKHPCDRALSVENLSIPPKIQRKYPCDRALSVENLSIPPKIQRKHPCNRALSVESAARSRQ
jgi:hypothetical protein